MGYYRQLEPWVFARIVFSRDKQMAIISYVGSLGGPGPELNNSNIWRSKLFKLFNWGRELNTLNNLNI